MVAIYINTGLLFCPRTWNLVLLGWQTSVGEIKNVTQLCLRKPDCMRPCVFILKTDAFQRALPCSFSVTLTCTWGSFTTEPNLLSKEIPEERTVTRLVLKLSAVHITRRFGTVSSKITVFRDVTSFTAKRQTCRLSHRPEHRGKSYPCPRHEGI